MEHIHSNSPSHPTPVLFLRLDRPREALYLPLPAAQDADSRVPFGTVTERLRTRPHARLQGVAIALAMALVASIAFEKHTPTVSVEIVPTISVDSAASEDAYASGDAVVCNDLGALHERAGTRADFTRAADLYRRACDRGVALGCSNLGALYARGRGVPRDDRAARQLFRAACQAGNAFGCLNLSEKDRSATSGATHPAPHPAV